MKVEMPKKLQMSMRRRSNLELAKQAKLNKTLLDDHTTINSISNRITPRKEMASSDRKFKELMFFDIEQAVKLAENRLDKQK